MSTQAAEYDILMATDLRLPGGTTASVVEEIEAQYRAGYRTGLLHMPSAMQRRRRPFADRIRRVLEDGKAELVINGDPVHTKLLLIRHPSVLSVLPPHLPRIDADHVVLVVNQVPEDGRGAAPYYDVNQVHRNLLSAFGQGVWAPIGPGVRTAVRAGGDVPMLEADWENIIDLDRWRTDRQGFVGDRPVIGRHSRGHWSKWPASREEILAAYPDDPHYQVRILGGTEAPEDILGAVPGNWATLPFDSVPIPQFLAGIDFLIYFHHPGLVEAFGRVVLEGMAAGAVCMAPRALEPIFGDACAYGTPAEVRGFVDAMYADPGAFARRSARGVDLVRERFSYQAHLERLHSFTGPPAQPEPSIDPVAPDTGTSPAQSTVICTLGQDPGDVAALLDGLDPNTMPVLLTDTAQDFHGEQALIETVPAVLADSPAAVRATDLRRRLRHLVRAHRAKQVLLMGTAAAALGGGFGDDVEALSLHRSAGRATTHRDIPDGWVVDSPPPPPPPAKLAPAALAKRTARQGIGLARRHAPPWARRVGRAGLEGAVEARRRAQVIRSAEHSTVLPVSEIYSHLSPDLPVALVTVASRQVEPQVTLSSLLGRLQTASSFRLVLLAPDNWIDHARLHNVTLETWASAEDWPGPYTVRRSEYVRERVAEVSRLVKPAVVVNIERTVTAHPVDAGVLDLLEAAGRARQGRA